MSQLTALRDQLKTGLSATAQQPEGETGPTVAELAEQIKALRAGNSVEATPQRTEKRRSSAEEPVTARIRRRSEAVAVSDQALVIDAASPSGPPLPSESTSLANPGQVTSPETPSLDNGTTQDVSVPPETTHLERVVTSQRWKENRPTMF